MKNKTTNHYLKMCQLTLNIKKKTGRGIEDYVKLNRDFDALDGDQILN